jgi:hypothetical protein
MLGATARKSFRGCENHGCPDCQPRTDLLRQAEQDPSTARQHHPAAQYGLQYGELACHPHRDPTDRAGVGTLGGAGSVIRLAALAILLSACAAPPDRPYLPKTTDAHHEAPNPCDLPWPKRDFDACQPWWHA